MSEQQPVIVKFDHDRAHQLELKGRLTVEYMRIGANIRLLTCLIKIISATMALTVVTYVEYRAGANNWLTAAIVALVLTLFWCGRYLRNNELLFQSTTRENAAEMLLHDSRVTFYRWASSLSLAGGYSFIMAYLFL